MEVFHWNSLENVEALQLDSMVTFSWKPRIAPSIFIPSDYLYMLFAISSRARLCCGPSERIGWLICILVRPRSRVSRRINYARYSRPTPRIADKELFIEPLEAGRVGVGGRPSIINVIRGWKRRCAARGILFSPSFSRPPPSLSLQGESSPGFLPHESSLASSRHPRSRQRDH